MLNVMRRHLKKLNWVLWIVILSFVATIFLVWGMDVSDRPGGGGNTIASVNGEPITRTEFYNAKRNLSEFFRNLYGERFQDLSQQLGLDRMALNQLIEEALVSQKADELDLHVSDRALQAEIASQQMFHENGRFSPQRYRMLLQSMGLRPGQYEQQVREDLRTRRLRNFVQAIARVTQKELETRYRMQNEQVSADAIVLVESAFVDNVQLTEQQKQAYYEQHKGEFQLPETVQVAYVLADRAKFAEKAEPSAEEVAAYYEQNKEEYRRDEEVHARHILFSLPPGATEQQKSAAVQKAQALRAELVGGRDFVEAANALTEDPSGKGNGGDLGWFGRGEMVPEFSEAAFSLAPSQISEPVTSQFGVHLIQVEEKREAGYQPLEEVTEPIRATLRQQKATELAQAAIEKARQELQAGKSVEDVVQTHGLESDTPGFFGPTDEIPGIGRDPALSQAIFALQQGNVSEVLPSLRGLYVFKLLERKAPHQGTLEEVVTQVTERLRKDKAAELVQTQAQAIKTELATTPLSQVARKHGLEVKNAPDLRRSGLVPGLGRLPQEAEATLFAAEPNTVIGPVKVDQGVAFLRLNQKKPADLAQLEQTREQLERELLGQKQQLVTQDWMTHLHQSADIEAPQDIQEVLQGQPVGIDDWMQY